MTSPFRQRLKSGETLLGTIASIPNIATAEILANAGFDWLFLDAEHSPLSGTSLESLLSGIGRDTATLVRVPAPEEPPIKQALDLGATGIIAPQVNTPDQAASVVRYARYAPEGARGVGIGRAHGYGMRFQEYLAEAVAETVVVVQAEHRDAVDNIEKTVQVEGIDAVLVGPYDLSASYGKMGELDDQTVVDAIQHVTDTCHKAKIPLGIFGLSPAAVAPFLNQGYKLIVVGVDALLLGRAAHSLQDEMRAQIKSS